MKHIMPAGARVFVRLVTPTDEVSERAKKAGLAIVVMEENKPHPTEGVVIALGTDPMIREMCQLGDHIMFSKHAGVDVQVDGETYRSINFNEIISVIRDIPEPSTQSPPQ